MERRPAEELFRGTCRGPLTIASFMESMIARQQCMILDVKKTTRVVVAEKRPDCFRPFGPVYALPVGISARPR